MIYLSDRAAEKLKEVLANNGNSDDYVRLGINGFG